MSSAGIAKRAWDSKGRQCAGSKTRLYIRDVHLNPRRLRERERERERERGERERERERERGERERERG